jgi:hypothetical protein
MATRHDQAGSRDLAWRLFHNRRFQLAWIAFLAVILTLVSPRVRDAALVCWVYGSDAYFHKGIRVVQHKPQTMFSNGEVAPVLPDLVTGFLTFALTAFGLTILLFLVLRCYERIFKRASHRSQ